MKLNVCNNTWKDDIYPPYLPAAHRYDEGVEVIEPIHFVAPVGVPV
jgi:hypothetical protein